MARFAGKVVIVTGSSNGIGRAAARLFAREGAEAVVVHGRSVEALEEARNETQEENASTKVLALAGDITDPSFQQKLIDSTVNTFGKLNILINNAGAAARGADSPNNGIGFDQSLEDFDYMISLNTKSVLALVRLAAPHLEKTQGEIVNISSIGGLHFAVPKFAYYGAAKAALDHLTRSMAVAYIEKGIRVNGINPGSIQTEFMTKLGVPKEAKDEHYAKRDSNRNNVPLGRSGTAWDIAKSILFLADRNSSEFIVGHNLVVDGGSTLNCAIFVAPRP